MKQRETARGKVGRILVGVAGLVLTFTLCGQVYEPDDALIPAFRDESLVPRFLARDDGSLWVVGCSFVDGVPVEGILRFRADGSMDAPLVVPDPDDGSPAEITALTESGEATIVCAAPHFLRVLDDGTLDPAFVAPTLWTGAVDRLLPSFGDGLLIPHGVTLRLVDGALVTRKAVARLRVDGSFDETFPDIEEHVAGTDASGRIYTTTDGTVKRYLESGLPDPAWSEIALNGTVRSFFLRPVGGGIAVLSSGLVRLAADGTVDSSFVVQGSAMENRDIASMRLKILDDDRVLVMANSSLPTYLDPALPYVVRLAASGQVDDTFVVSNTIGGGAAFWGDRPIVGYRDTYLRPSIAGRLEANGQLDPTWTPRFGGPGGIKALRADAQGRILVAGSFDFVDGHARSGVVRLLLDGAVDETFLPPSNLLPGYVSSQATPGFDELRVGQDGSVFLHESLSVAVSSPKQVRWTRLTAAGAPHPDQPPDLVGEHDVSATTDGSLYFSRPYSRDDTSNAGTFSVYYGFDLVRRAPGSSVDEVLPIAFAEEHFSTPSAYLNVRFGASPFDLLPDGSIFVAHGLAATPGLSTLVSADETLAVPLPFATDSRAGDFPIHGPNPIVAPDGTQRSTLQRALAGGTLDETFAPSWTLGDLRFLADDGRGGAVVARTPAFGHGELINRLRGDGTLDTGLQLDATDVLGAAAAGDQSLFLHTHRELTRLALVDRAEVTVPVTEAVVVAGRALTLSANVGVTGAVEWRWQHDGVDVPGATASTLTIQPATLADGGVYVAIATVGVQELVSPAISVKVEAANARLVNLSARTRVSAGDAQQIAGFVLAAPADVVVRAVGPALAIYDVLQPLADPTIVLRSNTSEVAQNAGWSDAAGLAAAFQRVGAFPYPAGGRDAALRVSLPAGLFTAKVSGSADGVGLAEIYLDDDGATAPLLNFSIRAEVGSGENSVIAGFVVGGEGPRGLLVRAVGPGLLGQGVPTAMANPSLSIFRGSAEVVTNDDATTEAFAAESVTGAFPLTPGAGDAAIVVYLEAGSYTAVVSGDGGIVLVEVYAMPPL